VSRSERSYSDCGLPATLATARGTDTNGWKASEFCVMTKPAARVQPGVAEKLKGSEQGVLHRYSLPSSACVSGVELSSLVPVNPAIEDMKNAVSVLGDVRFVGDQDNGVPLEVKLIEETHNLLRGL
jgi:hypothetical protein